MAATDDIQFDRLISSRVISSDIEKNDWMGWGDWEADDDRSPNEQLRYKFVSNGHWSYKLMVKRRS